MSKKNAPCRCGSTISYSECCFPYHSGAIAKDPKSLVQARFCAFALGQVDYILKTTSPQSPLSKTPRKDLVRFAQETTFLNLKLLSLFEKESSATLYFEPTFKQRGILTSYIEESHFEKIGEEWFFVNSTPTTVFTTPPTPFNPTVAVAGCYCLSEGKLLFLQRTPHKPLGNFWGIPAGKLEPGESPEEGCLREVQEETSITLSKENLSFGGTWFIRLPSGEFTFHFFRYHSLKKPTVILNSEHVDFNWVSPEEALQLNLFPGGAECLAWAYPTIS